MAGLGLAVGLVAAGIALAVSLSLPKSYDSEAIVLVGARFVPEPDLILAFQAAAKTYAGLATSEPLLADVIASVGLDVDTAQLRTQVSASAPEGLRTVVIRASGSSADEAAAIANAVADEVALLPVQPGGAANIATVFQRAKPPIDASEPRIALNTVVAGALGVIFGVGLGWLFGTRTTEL
jgi:capsular polysaccharide biosynthesis protein